MIIQKINFTAIKAFVPQTKSQSVENQNVSLSNPVQNVPKTSYQPVSLENFVILQSMCVLRDIEFSKEDVEYLEKMGVNPLYQSGKEAYDFIMTNNIKIKFAHLPRPENHAQWLNEENTILINEQYRNTRSFADILAISESILHEAGHAKDKDSDTSIQEEFDCLGLNVLANRYHKRKYPGVFDRSSSEIIYDGVALYSKLFFDKDKDALIARINQKYGHLPMESRNHKRKSDSLLNNFPAKFD